MKILQITPSYYPSIGGLQEHVRNISERMAGENQVTVFTGDSSGKLHGEEEINGVLVKRFHSFSPNNAYHLSLDMLKELRRSEFDVVHGHSYHALPLYFSRYARRKKFIITPHYHGHGHTPFRDVLFKLYKLSARGYSLMRISLFQSQIMRGNFWCTILARRKAKSG